MSEPSEQPPAAGGRRSWQNAGQLFLVTLLALPFLTPLWQWSSVPCTHDGHLHYHRVAAIRHAWENGLYFSRWLPDLAFGYGYPFFIYREPLPLYLTHFLHLAGLPLPAASNLLYAACILASGWFMFLWARDIFGARAALIAAVAYLSAPYVLVDALVRGNLVESVALALMPMLLWAGRRFLLSGQARWFLVSTFGLAGMALSHNISLLIFVPSLALYLLIVGRSHRLGWRPLILRIGLILGLGLGMTAFYTGSALLEMDQVTLSLSTTTRNNDFRFNFAALAEVLAPVTPEDPALLNPPLLFRLGWLPLGLALAGALSFFRNQQREQRLHILLMGGAAVIYLFFALAISRPLWEGLPLIEFVQFPWRFVGRAALPVALLAGALFACPPLLSLRVDRLLTMVALPAALLLLFLEGLPNLYPNVCVEDPFPSIVTVHQYERETGLVGVDPEGSYFPRTVQERPTGSSLETDYLAGRTPQRLDSESLPPDVVVRSADYGPNWARIEVDAGSPFQARYLTFAFPGWQASIDGRSTPIIPGDPDGLITFPVPAGEHIIEVQWRSTPLRTALLIVSLLALVVTIVVTVLLRRQSRLSSSLDDQVGVLRPDSCLSNRTLLMLGGLALLLLVVKPVWFDRHESPLRRSGEPPVSAPADIAAGLTGPELRLAGYRLSRDAIPAGETVDVDLAWQTLSPAAAAYQSNVWLVGPDGAVWSDKETHRPRVYEDAPATLSWPVGSWAWDSREVLVLTGAPPAVYDLVLTLFPLDTLQPLTLQDDAGNALGPTAVIGQVTVSRPDEAPTFTPQFPLTAKINDLTLLGYNLDRAEAAPGDPLLLTLFWEKADATGAEETLSVTLQTPDGDIAHEWHIPPVRADYPPESWAVGERLRGQHLLQLPAGLDSGRYTLNLEGIWLGELQINAPERQFTPPAFATPADVPFGDELALAGYTVDCPSPAGSCRLLLLWQALRGMEDSYHIFVHLVDEQGRILAQSDGQPAGWTRPTTGWAQGEFISDEHGLILPADGAAGEWSLRVGVYDPATGARLPIEDGSDFFTIPIVSQSGP